MKAPRLTGSALQRADICIASVVLPQTRTVNAYATFGTVLHRYLERIPKVGEDAALLEQGEEHRPALALIETEHLPLNAAEYAAEVAYAYNPETDTAREISRGKGREEAYKDARPGEILCTLDVVGISPDSAAVLDYKSGWGTVTAAKDNLQLGFGALCVARVYGRSAAEVAIVRVQPGREPWFDRAHLEDLDLDVIAAKVQGLATYAHEAAKMVAAGGTLEVTAGEHCKYCPAFSSCPEQMRLVSTVAGVVLAGQELKAPVLTAENFPLALTTLEAMEAAITRVRQSLEAFATGSPVDLGDGTVFGPRPFVTEKVSPDLARMVLTEELGAEVAQLAVREETTKGLIEDAIRHAAAHAKEAKKPKVVISKTKERVLDTIRARGGVEASVTYPVGRHKAKALKE